MFNFEKLDVWDEAIAFADLIYSVSRHFPDDERFGLTTQMRRAAVSISSNLAEGSSRVSRADFARFVETATGSLFEVVSHNHRQATGIHQRNRLCCCLRGSGKTEQNAQRSAEITSYLVGTLNSQPTTLNCLGAAPIFLPFAQSIY
jgi:four helix bundle protein